jgi:fibronectin-binding autotransporter adhesin
MKLKTQASMEFASAYRRGFLALLALTTLGITTGRADSPQDDWEAPNSNLLKAANWSTGSVPGANVIGVINDDDSSNGNVLGLDVASGTPQLGTIDLVGGADETVGTYNSKTSSDDNMTLSLLGGTLNNQANTIIANEDSGTSLTFDNDAQPSDKDPNSGILTLALNSNSTNIIQSSGAGNNIIINVSIAGSNDSLTFLGSGTGSLALNASNSYSGGTYVSSGIVVAGNSGALGTGAVSVNGGSLQTTVSTVDFGAGLTLSSGSVALNSATFSLASGTSFSQTGGTLDLTAGTPGAIDGSGSGTFSLGGGGTLDLGGSAGWNYSDTYDIFSGFTSGSVGDLTITDYDSTDYTASVSDNGVLSFAAVPEPSSYLLGLAALAMFASIKLRQKRQENA